jgi:secondary thiamine-phosphate synthase enzyme
MNNTINGVTPNNLSLCPYNFVGANMYDTIEVSTHSRTCLIDITKKVKEIVRERGIKDGIVVVYVPHTTAAIMVDENYDPSVGRDISDTLSRIIPYSFTYQHREGNADAHIKAGIVGSSRVIFIEDGKPVLGTWQGIFLCEFDGPRRREIFVKVIKEI